MSQITEPLNAMQVAADGPGADKNSQAQSSRAECLFDQVDKPVEPPASECETVGDLQGSFGSVAETFGSDEVAVETEHGNNYDSRFEIRNSRLGKKDSRSDDLRFDIREATIRNSGFEIRDDVDSRFEIGDSRLSISNLEGENATGFPIRSGQFRPVGVCASEGRG
jgi:hypothetical protein